MAIREAILDAAARLRAAGSPTPRLDAELLLGHVLGRERAWLLAHPEGQIPIESAFDGLVERRAAGEPVAYLRGFKEWHGLRISTDRRALIPRPETELLADAAAEEIESRLVTGPTIAWDVGTGTGAVAIALALRLAEAVDMKRLRIIASDRSPDALDLAGENLREHQVSNRVELIQADLLEPAGGAMPRPDVIVANLPYVASAEVDERHGSLGFEPRIALDGGPDGLELVRRLFDGLPPRAAPGAVAFLEIGAGQAGAVEALAPRGASVRVVPDLAGLDRVVRVEVPRLAR
jgi:release factor glutamine methyltransferase